MSNQTLMQAVVVDKEVPDNSTQLLQIALFNPDGSPVVIPDGAEPAEAHPDSEAATLEELVTDFNTFLAKLRASGQLQPGV